MASARMGRPRFVDILGRAVARAAVRESLVRCARGNRRCVLFNLPVPPVRRLRAKLRLALTPDARDCGRLGDAPPGRASCLGPAQERRAPVDTPSRKGSWTLYT